MITAVVVILLLWVLGAWGHHDLYKTPAWDERNDSWLVALCCVFWPLVIPLSLLIDLAEWITNRRRGF